MTLSKIATFEAGRLPNFRSKAELVAHYASVRQRLFLSVPPLPTRAPPQQAVPRPSIVSHFRLVAYIKPTYARGEIEQLRAKIDDLVALGFGPSASSSPMPTVKRILLAVSEAFQIPVTDLLSRQRGPDIARARQITVCLARRFTSFSAAEVGKRLGRHHATVLHAQYKYAPLLSAIADDHPEGTVEIWAFEAARHLLSRRESNNVSRKQGSPTRLPDYGLR